MAQAVSLSFFRFTRPGAMHWALWQMPLAMGPLSRLPGIGFHKTLGSGLGESFRPWPNFGVYAVLATWPSLGEARAQIRGAEVYRRYRAKAAEHWTVYLATTSVRGQWAGVAPFQVSAETPETPVAVLTRASIRPSRVLSFWAGAPDIDTQTAREPDLLFKRGLGELPWVRQVTFSIWRDLEAMRRFAYRHPFHATAARRAREGRWFSEELFARFRVLGCEGTWEGQTPLSELTQAIAEPV